MTEADPAFASNPVVRVEPSGTQSHVYYYRASSSTLSGIATGADGALWMTDPYGSGCCGSIVRMTAGGKFTAFTASEPCALTIGPDGALWFLQAACCHIFGFVSQIAAQGSIINYTNGMPWYTTIRGITKGPDGAVWFTEAPFAADPRAERIARVTTDGTITQFTHGFKKGGQPEAIAAGPDGAGWFTECEWSVGRAPRNAKVGRITMSGQITGYSNLAPASQPAPIIQGLGHDMWFIERATNRLARLRIVNL